MRHLLGPTLALVVTMGPAEAGPLSLEQFFRGRLQATGVVENLRNDTRRPFTIAMQANWAGPVGTLVEDVAYGDGEKDHKVWTFTKTGPGIFVGRREDLTRDAEVTEDAEGVHMVYKANTKVPPGLTLALSFDDRLTPQPDGTVTVHSDVTYLMVSAARVTMTIGRRPGAQPEEGCAVVPSLLMPISGRFG